MNKDVIIACDFANKEECMNFLNTFKDQKPFIKIGMELFYKEGPIFVKELKEKGYKIFLDLKLCDIPNTVMKAMESLKSLNIDIVNLHAFGGKKMMTKAKEVFAKTNTKVIAVTILTSIAENTLNDELLIKDNLEQVVSHYALNAKEALLDGVVCSPLEVPAVKNVCGNDFITVTPGIRFESDATNDQMRITTPLIANKLGTNYIVVGRSITAASDPVAAYNKCLKDFLEVNNG